MKTPSSDSWVLALDVGTSSARAIVFDSFARTVPDLRHQESYDPAADEPGQATFNAVALLERLSKCIDTVLAKAGRDAPRIRAVGVTTFWHSMVGVDGKGKAVTPLYTWADTRSANDVETLRSRLDPVRYHDRTGCAIHPSYFPARLAWLNRAEPGLYSQVDRWLSPGEYLFMNLFGEASCSLSMASGTGLLDQNRRDWDGPTLDALGISAENLAPLTDVDQPQSGLKGEFAKRWPALAEAPWVPAVGDGAASNVGSGCVTDRRIALNLGTSGAIRVCFEAEKVDIPADLWCYRLDRKRFVVGGAFSDGGELALWMKQTLKFGDWDAALAEIEAIKPGSHNLTFLPFLAGERSTGWRPDARATIHGLSATTTPAQIARAGMEAVALRFAMVHDMLRKQFPEATEIVAAGGAFAKAPFWAQIIADALGEAILLSEETEATSRGAAALALKAAGLIDHESDLPDPETKVIEPDPAHHAVYQDGLARQQALYEATLRL